MVGWPVPLAVFAAILSFALVLASGAPPTAAREGSPRAAEAVIEAAKGYVGLPYQLGTEGPDRFDCSGLIFRAFSDAGQASLIGGRRIRAAAYMRWFAGHGRFTTDPERLRRGDLVMYDHGKHIAIYLGDGMALSAVLSGVSIHRLHGLTQQVTGFLRVDWNRDGAEAGDPLLLPAPAEMAEEEPAELVPDSAWAPSFDEAARRGGRPTGVERADMRTAASRTFEQRDGSFVTELFASPIHYQPVRGGAWAPIELRFEDGALAGAPVALTVHDARRRGSLAELGTGGHVIGLGATGLPRGAHVEPVPGADGRYVDYSGLFGGRAGLRLFPLSDGLKAFLVLPHEPTDNRFELRLQATPLGAREAGGGVQLVDHTGDVVARLDAPLVLDSGDEDGRGGGVSTDAVALTLAGAEEERLLVVTLDRDYLGRASYPLYVDLTLRAEGLAERLGSTFVLSSRPDTTFASFQRPEWPAYPELWHGRLPGRQAYTEAYLRFADPLVELAGVELLRATLRIFPYWQHASRGGTWVGTPTGDWDPTTLTWHGRPASTELGSLTSKPGSWSELDVTDHVRAVVARQKPDHGFLLHANEVGARGWKRIAAPGAADAGALEPRLVVHWAGLRPSATDTVAGAGWDGALSWTHPAVAGEQWRFEVEIVEPERGVSVRSGVIRGDEARQQQWLVPVEELVPGESYSWRVRVRYGPGSPWSAWSEPARLAYGSDDAQSLDQQQRAEEHEGARGQ
ncbi:MAG TPA: DNRLRE domain-containing protein [Candidatus Limnocylindrales bacterium]|nr:DNRLRE domain-containing protein [Candidatus Limnocylindrales bacterium]